MTALLPNFVSGRWQAGTGAGSTLLDPVLGTALVRVDATGLDLPAAFDFARRQGSTALQALTYRERAALLAQVGQRLQTHREAYDAIATANSGTVKNDSAVDIDGALFTLGQYARWGEALGDARALRDGEPARLAKEAFQSQHVQVPRPGLALFINAFNFPAWGLWEKAAPALARHAVRANIEADSLNSALALPDATPGTPAFEGLVREVVREMTVKSGQKCTAIRRILVPEAVYGAAAETIAAKLAKVSTGNPRNAGVRMGALVSRAQFDTVQQGVAELAQAADVLHDGRSQPLVDADPAVAACVAPVLLGTRDADGAQAVHDVEVFGPVATLLAYRDLPHALALARRGQGSLVASLYGDDAALLGRSALALAASHGRVHMVTPEVAQLHTGHGNVMPQSLHGGPGRAGGGAELGGLRALDFYHQRSAVQASPQVLAALGL